MIDFGSLCNNRCQSHCGFGNFENEKAAITTYRICWQPIMMFLENPLRFLCKCFTGWVEKITQGFLPINSTIMHVCRVYKEPIVRCQHCCKRLCLDSIAASIIFTLWEEQAHWH